MGNVGVKPDTLADGAINERTDTVITAADEIIFGDVTDSNNLKKDTVQGILDLQKIVQVVNVQSGALITTTTVIPSFDDTIPQNTEGVELMTLAITPTNANNILEITVVTSLSLSVAPSNHTHVTALFQDSTADALASQTQSLYVANGMSNTTFKHRMTAGTASETTFKVRGGCDTAGTTSFNGSSGSRVNGGTMASSITITEISV